jgi:TRAP-type C4-dicarboxylate transport system permease small subunit
VLDAYLAFDRFLMRWTMRAAMALLVLCCFVSFYQVVTRFLFEQPSTWSEVVARSLDIWMVYLGVAVAFRTGALMSVEFLAERLRGRARVVLLSVIALVCLLVLGIIVWFGFAMVARAQFQMLAGVENPFTGEGISIAVVYAAVPVGACLAIVGLLARLIEDMRSALASGEPVATRREIFEV